MSFSGSSIITVSLAELGKLPCPYCREPHRFRAFLNYRESHFFWIFGMITSRNYMAACTRCQKGSAIEKNLLPPDADKYPIPFMQKWGLVLLFSGVILILTVLATRLATRL